MGDLLNQTKRACDGQEKIKRCLLRLPPTLSLSPQQGSLQPEGKAENFKPVDLKACQLSLDRSCILLN